MLNSKQRAYLKRLANTIPSILQVGKGGLDENYIKQLDEMLEARELIKGNVLKNTLFTAREAAEELAEAVGADVVVCLGNRFVLYRPSKENKFIVLPK